MRKTVPLYKLLYQRSVIYLTQNQTILLFYFTLVVKKDLFRQNYRKYKFVNNSEGRFSYKSVW